MARQRSNRERNSFDMGDRSVRADAAQFETPSGGTRAKSDRRARMRNLWLSLHFYLGVIAGAVFVMVGLTGSILAFRAEIDSWLNPYLAMASQADGQTQYRSLDEIIAAGRAAGPPDGTAIFVHFPRDPAGFFDVILSTPEDHGHEKIHQVVLNPYDASVIGKRVIVDMENHFSEPFVMFVMHLHSTLLRGRFGKTAIGLVGLLLLGSLASGVYLWWPRNGKWRMAFSVKRNASGERLILDLHKTAGIYACAFLSVILFSGVYLIFDSQVRALVGLFSPTSEHMISAELKSEPSDGRAPLGADAAASIVERLFHDGRLMSLQLPSTPDGVYVVGKRADDEIYKSETKRLVAVDQYTGSILQIQDPHQFTAGERFLEWQFPLHTGEAFGDAGRVLIFVLGFFPALLYLTGVIRWLQKRRARSRRPPQRSIAT